MAEVLAEHQWYDGSSDQEDPAIGCTGCPEWFSSEYALDDGTFAAHQAEVLAANGYGKLEDARPLSRRQSSRAVGELIQAAKAKAWDQGMDAGRKYPANAKAKNPYRRPE